MAYLSVDTSTPSPHGRAAADKTQRVQNALRPARAACPRPRAQHGDATLRMPNGSEPQAFPPKQADLELA